jgi:hypothetical protein
MYVRMHACICASDAAGRLPKRDQLGSGSRPDRIAFSLLVCACLVYFTHAYAAIALFVCARRRFATAGLTFLELGCKDSVNAAKVCEYL